MLPRMSATNWAADLAGLVGSDATVVAALIGLVATVVAALIGLGVGFITAEFNRRQKADELFFRALDFLTGKSQVRNLGIAAIELYWRRRRHRDLCISLLAGSAIYLLLESEQDDAAHEVFNLDRIMAMLTSQRRVRDSSRLAYAALTDAVQRKIAGHPRGLTVAADSLNKWKVALTGLAAT